MSTVLRIGTQGKGQTALPAGDALDTRIALIQALIPLGPRPVVSQIVSQNPGVVLSI